MKNKFKKGFSMEELIVVCAIIGIMTTAVVVSMRGNKDERAVETSAREVAAAIRQAQNYALTGKGAGVAGCTNYQFHCVKDNDNYWISGCASANYTLKNGVRFKNTANTCESPMFTFSLPHAETSIGAGNSMKIILEDRNGSNEYTICIYDKGNVIESSGDVNCS